LDGATALSIGCLRHPGDEAHQVHRRFAVDCEDLVLDGDAVMIRFLELPGIESHQLLTSILKINNANAVMVSNCGDLQLTMASLGPQERI
jgi:hypothetical protein